MQISCVTREILLDVYEYHEKYPNLVVRVAGYSEYFINLSDEIKKAVYVPVYFSFSSILRMLVPLKGSPALLRNPRSFSSLAMQLYPYP